MRIIFTGGGTGGHIYPALALARYIKRVHTGADLLFVGAQGGMEEKIVPAAGFPLKTLAVQGIPRRFSPALFKSVYLLGKADRHAQKILKEFQPDLVFGTGGYAAASLLIVAIRRRLKVFLHEQNVIPGLTNRFLAPWVNTVCLSFQASRRYFLKRSNLHVTGNPRASEVGEIKKADAYRLLGLEPGLPLILVVSGSRGAAAINAGVADFLGQSSGYKNFQTLYITGEKYYEKIMHNLREGNLLESYGQRLRVRPYQPEMPLALAAADLIVTRAGATTIAEITARGVPAIVIPSPNVVHNHQLLNARELLKRGAAVVLEETKLNGKILQQEIFNLLDNPTQREQMGLRSKKMGYPRAAGTIYELILKARS